MTPIMRKPVQDHKDRTGCVWEQPVYWVVLGQKFKGILSMANKALSVAVQAGALRKKYDDGSVTEQTGDHLIWKWKHRPTPCSPKYTIKMKYKYKKHPDVYVLDPKPLPLAKGETRLPHVYNNEKQHICLYFRKGDDWSADKLLSETVVPWIAEWLYFYEIWQYTGKWLGLWQQRLHLVMREVQ